MAYKANTRDRVEAYPAKGTADKLRVKAKAKKMTFTRFVSKVLERAAA